MGVSREAGGFELQVGKFKLARISGRQNVKYRHKICKEENL